MPQLLSTRFNTLLPQINQLNKIQSKHQQLHKILPHFLEHAKTQNLWPVKYKKTKPPRVIIQEKCVNWRLIERENGLKVWGEKTERTISKTFSSKKEIIKSEAAKANKQVRKTPTIRSLIKPTKIAEETIQQSLNTLPPKASLKIKTKEPVSALTYITII